MKLVFADAFYWIALVHPRDSARPQALSFGRDYEHVTLVTTHEVLTEVLAFFSGGGIEARRIAFKAVRRTLQDPRVLVIPQSTETFEAGLQMYGERLDKGYSHTDCVSMIAMRSRGIVDDRHFKQEGFRILFDSAP